MAYRFPSEEWVAAYREAINANDEYKKAGATWDKGAVALIVLADPNIGIASDVGIYLDLHKGECRAALLSDRAKAESAPFCITGEYPRWKQVIEGKLDPVKGMMQGKLRLKGDLPTIVRYVKASNALVAIAASVPTLYPDEK